MNFPIGKLRFVRAPALSRTVALTIALALALVASMGNALAAPSLMTPSFAAKVAAPQFDIKSQATPVMLNRAALAYLQKQDELEFLLPDSTRYMIVFDRIDDHGSDIRSSVGYLRDYGKDYRVILTTGPSGTFGSIRTPETIYRIVPGANGQDLLVNMTEEQKLIPYVDLGDDARRVPDDAVSDLKDRGLRASMMRATDAANEPAIGLAAPTPQASVDLMIVYTSGLATKLGANLLTRFNNLVTAANTAYIDSEVAITLRLVNTTMVNYSDATSDSTALDDITPGRPGFDPVFSSIESIRNANGADLVTLMRDGGTNGGSGIAWITTSQTPNANFMYSVVTGCTAGCDSVFIHELGHNMGNAHDRATAAYQAGGVANPSGGPFPYSFGHYFCQAGLTCNPNLPSGTGGCTTQPVCATTTANNIGTIMSYFNPVTLKFSNPNLLCARSGGIAQPCGVADQDDNARSMNNMRIALQNIKASVGATSTTSISSSANPSVSGQSITLTARVAGSVGAPTGSVTFRDGASVISGCATSALTAGVAQCVTSALTVGSHSITASYLGNSTYNVSTSPVLTQTVNATSFLLSVTKAGTGIGQVTSSPAGIDTGTSNNSATFNAGQAVTLTASAQSGSSFAGWTGGGCGVTPTCVIILNAVTSVTATFNIIQNVPGAPTIGTATPGNAMATIAFTPPASDGNSAITGYTATCNPGALTGSSTASPVSVRNLVNGTPYTCAVVASNAIGSGAASATVSVTPAAGAALALAGVVSRKLHGGLGPFDVVIDTAQTINVTVEPRNDGSAHTVVFQFNNSVASSGTLSVVDSSAANVGATAAVTGNDVVVTIPTLADNKRVTISLTGTNGALNTSASIGFLVGDVNNTRSVNSSDISAVKTRSGQTANASNFKFDVNASGAINSSDISAVKARSGLALP